MADSERVGLSVWSPTGRKDTGYDPPRYEWERGDERVWTDDPEGPASRREALRIPLTGVYAFAVYRSGEGWPMSNYRPEGCKHDATGEMEQKLDAGTPQRCVKCGCLLIPEATYRAALADFERRWGQ